MENRNNFYTLEEKLELYMAALDYLRFRACMDAFEGFCRAVDVVIDRFRDKYPSNLIYRFDDSECMTSSPFPELLVFKPKRLVYHNGESGGLFWFPLNEKGLNTRIEILELIIKNLQDGKAIEQA